MLFAVKDPLGRTVGLSKKVWEEHIVIRHPEFVNQVNEVKHAVEKPDVISSSSRKENRDTYYKLGAIKKYPKLYITVIVEFEQNAGEIKTAHLSGSIVSPGPGGYKYVYRSGR
ncbi:MAG: hypothetical protein AB1556_10720 [Bacillota bacterium]